MNKILGLIFLAFSSFAFSKYRILPLEYKNNGVLLSGELVLPTDHQFQRFKKFPAIIIVHGSGQNKRDNWKDQTEFLLSSGIAIFRFDKRGSGKSTGDWKKSALEDLAADVNKAQEILSKRREINTQKIGLWGGSQGFSVGAIALANNPKLAFGILASGHVGRLWDNDNFRFTSYMRRNNFSIEDISRFESARSKLEHFVKGNISYQQLEAVFSEQSNRKILGFLSPNGKVFPKNYSGTKFWQLNIDFDNRKYLKQIKVPLLTIWGDKDEGVDIVTASKQTSSNYKGSDHTSVILPSADHGLYLRKQPGPGMANKGDRQLHPLYQITVINWMRRILEN